MTCTHPYDALELGLLSGTTPKRKVATVIFCSTCAHVIASVLIKKPGPPEDIEF